MGSRYDEEYVKNIIRGYLLKYDGSISIEGGEDPPDYYVNILGKKIPLEITRAEVEYEDDAKLNSLNTSVESMLKLLNDIDSEYKHEDYEYGLSVHVLVPVNDYKRFKKNIRKAVQAFVSNIKEYEYHEYYAKYVDGEEIMVSKLPKNHISSFILGSVGTKDEITTSLIQDQTDIIYLNVLKKKERKIRSLNGEKWLGIYNSYILSGLHNIIESLNRYREYHSFTKLFIIYDSNKIYEYDPNCA